MSDVAPGFAAQMRQLVVADIRTAAERRTLGWIPGSRRVYPWMMDQLVPGVIVVCQTGRRSAEALQEIGLDGPHIYNLTGGIRAWEAAGFPLCRPLLERHHQLPAYDVGTLMTELRSCFLVESVVAHPDDDNNPVIPFETLFPRGSPPADRSDFEHRLDQLGEAAWTNGHDLSVIARNIERFYRMGTLVRW